MYVFYPASRVVGLSFDYREISQVCPSFPPENSSRADSEQIFFVENQESTNNAVRNYQTLEGSDDRDNKSDCLPRRTPLLGPKTKKSQSESPLLAPKKAQRKKKSKEVDQIVAATSEDIKLGENLKNLEIYVATKPSPTRKIRIKPCKKPGNSAKMSGSDCALSEMTHPALNETLKSHNCVTFKLLKAVSEFTESLARIHEHHAEEMQLLVSNFRKKNSEFRKERPTLSSSLFHSWETFLQKVEMDSQAHSDIASVLGRQISRPLLEKSFFRKIQSRKVFSHRDTYENVVEEAEEKLGKTRVEYKTAYLAYMNGPSTQTLANYIACHNEYVSQLHLTNGMLAQYHSEILPSILQEIEEIYNDLCVKVSDSILQVAEVISLKAQEQMKRYDCLSGQCRSVQGPADLAHLVRSASSPGNQPPVRRHFLAPQPPPLQGDGQTSDAFANPNLPPPLKNEIVLNRLTNVQIREKIDSAKKESSELEMQVKQLSDALHTLARVQQRSIDSNLFNKVNELQEDISSKRQELNVALLRLAGLKAQKELYSNKAENAEAGRERKMSSSSTGSMKSKWMKALKSLKTPPANGNPNKDNDKKNGKDGGNAFSMDSSVHAFQDYTYKKITPCDVCSQVLRGHTRQGLKCRICKMNVHVDCQEKASKCQQKSRLLRRQKSTSEIDTRIQDSSHEEETVAGTATSVATNAESASQPRRQQGPILLRGNTSHVFGSVPYATNSDEIDNVVSRRLFSGFKSISVFGGKSRGESSSARSISLPETPHSPRKHKLNLRMKSLSLDSPESTEHAQKRRAQASHSAGHSSHGSSSKLQSPSSPVHSRRLLSARNVRMSSVELPDDNEKSLSSASTSPCPSPKPHRLLPTNLYVVLYNFKSRHPDELDLKAGYKVTVLDSNDPDWWKGKCFGRVGFFPSKYVIKLEPGERPLQVTHNLQVQDGDTEIMLLRDQIVIQVGEDVDGMVMIRSADNKQGACPLKFLQEV